MKIVILLLITISITFSLKGQTLNEVTEALNKINNLDQIDELKAEFPYWFISIDKTTFADSSKFPEIIKAKVGDIVLKQNNAQGLNFVLKILAEKDEEFCKVKYIYLNGTEISKAKIDSLRAIIINLYNNGESFESLNKTYSMDGNPTCELGWFNKGMMIEEFDEAVRERKKGEIFTVDVDQYNWYYVVLKTYENRMEKTKIAVMIQYN